MVIQPLHMNYYCMKCKGTYRHTRTEVVYGKNVWKCSGPVCSFGLKDQSKRPPPLKGP